MKKLGVFGTIAIALVAFAASPSSAAVIIIDDYTSPVGQGVTATVPTPVVNQVMTPAANLAPGLLSQRTFSVIPVGNTGLTASLRVAGGLLNYSNDNGVTSVASVAYSGLLDLTGLTAFQFNGTTDGGGVSANLPFTLTINTTGGTKVGAGVIPFPGGLVTIPLANFTPGGNLAQVTGITFTFSASVPNIDGSVDNLVAITATVPEPSTMICLGVGLACAAGVRRLRRSRQPA